MIKVELSYASRILIVCKDTNFVLTLNQTIHQIGKKQKDFENGRLKSLF